MRYKLATLSAGITIAAALLAPAAAHADSMIPNLKSPNGCGVLMDEGNNGADVNIGGYIVDFCNVPVSPSGYFEIYFTIDKTTGPVSGCLSVDSSLFVNGWPAVTEESAAGCDSGGNGYAWDHWSAMREGTDSNGNPVWAFRNAYLPGNCLYINNVFIATSCDTAGTDAYQHFAWPGSNL